MTAPDWEVVAEALEVHTRALPALALELPGAVFDDYKQIAVTIDKAARWALQHGPAIDNAEGEHCDDCGRAYSDVYWLDQDLWDSLHERAPAGLLCPSCAVRRAGRLLPQIGEGE